MSLLHDALISFLLAPLFTSGVLPRANAQSRDNPPVNQQLQPLFRAPWMAVLGVALAFVLPVLVAQTNDNHRPFPASPPPNSQEIPDAPSAVQSPESGSNIQIWQNAVRPWPWRVDSTAPEDREGLSVDPVTSIAPGAKGAGPRTSPRNLLGSPDDLYKISVSADFVQIPVMVKNNRGWRVDGLLPKDFTVKEDGQPQTLTFFTSDPFQLSVAVVLDFGMADAAVQKVNQTYGSLAGAFGPDDEVALYTYSGGVSQVIDFTSRAERLSAVLNSLKLVSGRNNGPPVLGGPLGPQPPMVNGFVAGTAVPPPVLTPPKESRVLNDAILRAAIDLSKRDPTRRKIILVISDGRERRSRANFRQVMQVLQTHDIQVKALVVDQGALPVYKQLAKLHLPLQGHSDLLLKYTNATGGGTVLTKLTRKSIEHAYSEITYEARNQYTLGYKASRATVAGPYRKIEVVVNKRDVKVYSKGGYYFVPPSP